MSGSSRRCTSGATHSSSSPPMEKTTRRLP
jgi:hypothetical protein